MASHQEQDRPHSHLAIVSCWSAKTNLASLRVSNRVVCTGLVLSWTNSLANRVTFAVRIDWLPAIAPSFHENLSESRVHYVSATPQAGGFPQRAASRASCCLLPLLPVLTESKTCSLVSPVSIGDSTGSVTYRTGRYVECAA